MDAQQPTITNCPTNQAVQTTAGMTTTVSFAPAAATDNSGIDPTITYTTLSSGVTFSQGAGIVTAYNAGVGQTIVTVTATDGSNNVAFCTFTVSYRCVIFHLFLLFFKHHVHTSSYAP